jgi:hypothetical protein
MASLRMAVVPSARLGVLLCIVHVGAGALGALLPVPFWSKAVLLTAVAWSLAWSLQTHALVRAREAIVGIALESDRGIIAHTREGASLECELMPSSFVSHRLTVLNVRPRGTRRERHVVLCCGNVDEVDLRRLRVRLRWAVPKSMHLEA